MRPVSPAALARRYAPAQRASWLLTLTAGSWTWRGATLAATLGSDAFPARLAGPVRWREALPDTERPGGLARASAEVRILDLPGSGEALRDRLATTPPVGIAATLRLAWLGEGDAPMAADDAAVLLEGRVTAWRIESLGVTLTLADEFQALAGKRIGRMLHPAMLTLPSPSFGLALPWIFGRLAEAELLPLAAGAVGRLAQALDDKARTIPLDSLDGFPTHGRVQVGGELIDYSEVDPYQSTLGSALAPAWRESPAAHPRGAAARWVPPGGFAWLVADHPCRAVEAVHADGIAVSPALWSVSTISLGGEPVTIITMARWPLGEDGREACLLTAAVQGLADEGGALLENPARVIQRLLTDPRLAALAPGRLDPVSFDQAAAGLDARAYRFARRLSGGETLGGLLESAAREAGLWLHPGQPVRLTPVEPTPQPAAVEEDLTDARWLDPLAPAHITPPRGLLPPDAVELVGVPRPQGRGRPAFRFPTEIDAPGALPRRFAMQWLDVERHAAAGDAGEFLWTHLGEAPFIVEREAPLGAALLAAGATVRLSAPALDLDQALAWVEAVELVPPARVRLRLRGPWAGDFIWRADSLNHIRRYAFGSWMALTLGGAVVARLSRTGALRLRGCMREAATIAAGPFDSPVALSGGMLYLCAPSAGKYLPFLAIDAAGNAELAGTIRERSASRPDPAGLALGAGDGRFWLSPDGRAAALAYESGVLHLKSILIESVRL